MSGVIVRLRDAMTEDSRADLLKTTYDGCSDPEGQRFLAREAMEGELENLSRTYLAVDSESDRVVGYFTILAADGCTFDHPAYTIHRIGAEGPAELEEALIRSAAQLFCECGKTVGSCSVTARCDDGRVCEYERAGFMRLCRDENGMNVMGLEV